MAVRNVWRKVNGQAIFCGDCTQNQIQVGGSDVCTATNGICVFMGKAIDAQKTYEDFREVYADDGDPGGSGGDASRAGPIPDQRKSSVDPPQIWRKVRGRAMFCGDCTLNKYTLSSGYYCDAVNEVCVFLKKQLDSQKIYEDFHDVYNDDEVNE